MASEILTTKLFTPPLRPGLVHRLRLLEKMSLGLQEGRRLTLITGPAGYGKTTLILEWLASLERAYTWLSLDRSDNHPIQFLTYLIAALGQIDAQIGKVLKSTLDEDIERDEKAPGRSLLQTFVNELMKIEKPFVVVLDDYHTITALEVNQLVQFLLEHQPPQMHLVIATRQDPLLPCSKLRARSQLTEIRLGELRFTQEEADQFLNETMRLGLLPEEVAALEARTEGWIAGLQLAALSLFEQSTWSQTSWDAAARVRYIQAFAGDDRHIMDYLLDEVLSHQSEDVQKFLLCTSVLERFSAPLCNAILDSGELNKETSSQTILEYLDRSNLFVIPLDNRREWYRYHHLFADLLINRLQFSDPDSIPVLHSRAGHWYERQELMADAIDHAILAEDFERALSLIEQTARTSIWASGDLPVLLNWARRLPEDVFMTRPRLSLYNARALFFAGQVEAAQQYMRSAEEILKTVSPNDPSYGELYGVFYTNEATFAALSGNYQTALELAQQALTLLPKEHFSSQAMAYHAIGLAEYYAGRVRPAEHAFTQAVHLARRAGNCSLAVDASASLAETLHIAGQQHRALQICEEALAFDDAARQSLAASAIYITQARILLVLNEPKAALEKMEIGIELARQLKWAHVLWRGYGDLSAIQLRLGDMPGLQEALRQLELLAQQYPLPAVGRIAGDWRARLALALGDKATAFQWAETRQPSGRPDAIAEYDDVTLIRIWIAQGRADEALALLNVRLPLAECEGRLYMMHEMYVLRAAAHSVLGDSKLVLEDLSCVLRMGLPDALLKSDLLASVSRGESLVDMLRRIHKTKDNQGAADLAGRILTLVGSPVIHPPMSLPAGLTGIDLPEPLTARELEVLQLIAEGLSNPKIAARLYLSVNTLRVHTMHIYQKLDVHNRIQAVARAQELGLLHSK